MSNFRSIDRQTGFLLPPSVDEWLPEKHLARFVVEVIDGLDLRMMRGSYRGSVSRRQKGGSSPCSRAKRPGCAWLRSRTAEQRCALAPARRPRCAVWVSGKEIGR